jgi:hypothetical protein
MSALRRTLTVPSRRGGRVIVIYRPSDLTLSDYEGAEIDPLGTAVKLIVSSVARWDIMARDGGVYPITPASVRQLPAPLVLDIAAAIAADVRALVVEEIARQGMTAA